MIGPTASVFGNPSPELAEYQNLYSGEIALFGKVPDKGGKCLAELIHESVVGPFLIAMCVVPTHRGVVNPSLHIPGDQFGDGGKIIGKLIA